MRYCVLIFTHNRPAQLLAILSDLRREMQKHQIDIYVYDDGSDADYREVVATVKGMGGNYTRSQVRHGKLRFWQWTNRAYADLRTAPFDRFVQLPDDVRLARGFFERAEAVWSKISDDRKIALSVHVDDSREHQPCWTNFSPKRLGEFDLTGWVDGAFYSTRDLLDALNWELTPIKPPRNRNRSSGVGSQMSRRLFRADYAMYRVHQSLVRHTYDPSQMHPQERAQHPLHTVRFADGPDVVASLATVPDRVSTLGSVLESLAPQVDQINIYLNGHRSIPKVLEHPKVQFATSATFGDRGDAGKFFWATTITGYHFVCDDDLIYPPDYVARLRASIDRFQRTTVVGLHGITFRTPIKSYRGSRRVRHCLKHVAEDAFVHMLGTGAMAYHADTLAVKPSDFRQPNMADIWFGRVAQSSRVPLLCLGHESGWLKLVPGQDHRRTIFGRMCRGGDLQQTRAVMGTTWRTWQPEHPLGVSGGLLG